MATNRQPKRSLEDRIADADSLASRWLGDGNEAAESGDQVKAEACYEKSQYWLDRYNLLTNRGSKQGPKV